MTEKLYYKDAYIREFSAEVISSTECEKGFDTVLSATAFFPEEGGQYSDRGTIGGVKVLDVKEKNGIIHHYTEYPLEEKSTVRGRIDFDERYEKMQCHTGEHILSGIFNSLYGMSNVGFHLGHDDVTMDLDKPLTRQELDRVETLANEVIYKNIEVETYFPSAEELAVLNYRSKLDLTENVRIVRIKDTDTCACCAPHVKSTGEVGVIKILDFAKLRGGIRIHIAAGRRALKIFRELYEEAAKVSGALCVPKGEISEGVGKLLSDFSELKLKHSSLRRENIERDAHNLEETEGNVIRVFKDAEIPELISFANIATGKVGGVLVLLSEKQGGYKYVMSSKSVELGKEAENINQSLGGKGGGKAGMIQGSLTASLEEVEEYFK